ncbi:MAG: outer membrane lipoprotein-sorting protein [Candidatus Zixiibacteriota bacterium]
MKLKTYIIFALLFGCLCAQAASAQTDIITADSIIHRVTRTMNPSQSEGKMQMTIMTTSKKTRTFVYLAYSKNHGEKTLMKYLEPSRVKGQAILMLNNADDIWVYFPRTRRVRKLATHAKKQKMEGSDFSYEDMGAGDAFIDEFNSRLLGEEKKEGKLCYELELTRKPKSTSGYSKLLMWVDKENFVPLVMDYYHDDDSTLLEKELVCGDIKIIDDIPTPMQVVMYNKLDRTQTSMEMVEVSYKVDLEEDLFTERGMKK